MEYVPLGNTGLYVSRLCFGAMTFAEPGQKEMAWIGTEGQDFADRMVGKALDAGITFFDTANMYASGASERMLGKALKGKRDDVVIATKLYHPMSKHPNSVGTSRISVMKEVEDSLQRLGTDHIDLYQVHGWDSTTPIEETMRALDDCVRQGKVRYIGMSNFAGWQIAHADGIARELGTERFCSVQAYYSLVGRDLERDIIPCTQKLGVGTMIYSPLAAGFLSGKYTDNEGEKGRRSTFSYPPVEPDYGDRVVRVMRKIGETHGVSPSQVALAWLLKKDGVTSIIVGARKIEQLEDNLASLNVELTDDDMAQLDEVSAVPMQYPQWQPELKRMQDAQSTMEHTKKVGSKK